MALTRAMLKGMGLTDEQVSAIIEEHTSVTDGLKAQRDKYKENADKVPDLEKQLEDLKTSGGDWETKYTAEHDAFEKYKGEVTAKEKIAAIEKAYRKLLKEANVGEKHIDAIVRVTKLDDMKLDKEGNLEDAEKLKKSVEEDYSGFIAEKGTKGADVDNPPASDGNKPKVGRAAQLAAQYHDNLYGTTSKEG